MDWLTRHLPRTQEEVRREERTNEVVRNINAFMQEVRDEVRSIQEAGADERKGFPVEHALRRRRPE